MGGDITLMEFFEQAEQLPCRSCGPCLDYSWASIAHVGMLDNIYFLPFSSHTATLFVTAASNLILICLALGSLVAAVVRRSGQRRGDPAEMANKLTGLIALATAGAFVCAFTYLPGGPLFDSMLLRVAFTILACIATGATLMIGFSAVRLLSKAAIPIFRKMQALLAAASAIAVSAAIWTFWIPVSWRSTDCSIDRVAKWVHSAAIFVQSTLIDYDTFSTSGRTALIDDPVVDFLMPSTREAWREETRRGIPFNRLTTFNQKVARALYRNGVPIMAGTDAMGLPLVAPGNSLHRELQLLSASGFSRYEAMRSATVVPAAFLGKANEFGTIAAGQRADLLLVAGNPLEDLAVLKRPSGVMVRGRWLPRKRLDELLRALASNE
jgi:Amidohydrolase family